MDYLCDQGLPYEYVESQFFANKMNEQSAKLSLLQLEAFLKPHERHLREWNTVQVVTDDRTGKEQKQAIVLWNNTYFHVMLADILREELDKLPVKQMVFN